MLFLFTIWTWWEDQFQKGLKKEQLSWTHSWLDIGQDLVYLVGPTPTRGPSWLFGSLLSMSVWVFLFPSITLLEYVSIDPFGEVLEKSLSWFLYNSPWCCSVLLSLVSFINVLSVLKPAQVQKLGRGCVCVWTYVYIYRCIRMYNYICTHTHTCVYIYIEWSQLFSGSSSFILDFFW